MSSYPSLSVKKRMNAVLLLLATPDTEDLRYTTKPSRLQDHGYCGPRGRVITGTHVVGGCEITGNFHRDPDGAYVLRFELKTTAQTTTDGIIEAADTLAQMHAVLPTFTWQETNEVYAALNDKFGEKAVA